MRFAVVQIIALAIPLLVAGTCLMGGVAWWNIAKYHLPVSKIAAFFATILPFVNYIAYKFLVARSYRNAKGQQRINISPLTALASIILYSLNVVLLTFSSTYLTEPTAQCVLSERWTKYYQAKSPHIRDIQNVLQCCGFHSQRDMPYPFPSGNNIKGDACAKNLGSDAFCLPLWSTEMKKNAGMLVGAGALIIFVNLVTLLVVLSNSRVLNRLLFFPFKGPRDYHQFMQDDESSGQQQERRLIEPYREDGDEEGRGDEEQRGDEQRQQQQRAGGNQSLENDNNEWLAITAQDDWEAAESQRLLNHSNQTPVNRYN